MKGDFSRNTFEPRKHFSRVLMQQGRVQLDADWNEQAAILLHYLRTLTADLIGPHGGQGDGFKIEPRQDQHGNVIPYDVVILPGHYYVDGILCENEGLLAYTEQPDYPLRENEQLEGDTTYLVYMDVWERHITYIEDESIREVALGGSDTATRARVVWQVKVVPIGPKMGREERIEELKRLLEELERELQAARETGNETAVEEISAEIQEARAEIARLSTGEPVDVQDCDALLSEKLAELGKLGEARLRARARPASSPEDSGLTPSAARYLGAENHLYRVEVHYGSDRPDGPTFKWSRENGSVVFPIGNVATDRPLGQTMVTLEHLGSDSRFGPEVGDWVEIIDDDYVLQERAEPLLKVSSVDHVSRQVTLEGTPASQVGRDPAKHPLLRRWDHRAGDPWKGGLELCDGAAIILEGADDDGWLNLEDGVQIQFQPDTTCYRTDDYWLIPARIAMGDVEWPRSAGGPEAVPPQGVEYHYAPLAIISVKEDGTVDVVDDCRYQFELCRTPVKVSPTTQGTEKPWVRGCLCRFWKRIVSLLGVAM